MKQQAEKAFQEMLDISTDLDKAVLFRGDEVIVSNFPESLQASMVAKAKELAALGGQKAQEMGGSPLTQLVVETDSGSVFVVREAKDGGMGVLATGKKDSRIGLVFYDMKTCIRDSQESEEMASPAAGGGEPGMGGEEQPDTGVDEAGGPPYGQPFGETGEQKGGTGA
jgi:predicted regulator of Ras-like GTPase activity (Roadblock/LC7/MglB family)